MSSAGPRRLGPYELLSPLGEGGMGEVWKARDTRLDRTVAVKISKEEFGERFEREARAVAALNHPHICTLHDVGPNYLVMEYIEGKPLQGPLPVDQVIRYARQIADALDTAHRNGIIHRDLKPANILLTKAGIKLLDFGLAKQAEAPISAQATVRVGLSQPGMIMGTPQYMSPEQVEGLEVDTRSDIFSLGLVLYELITGKPAFEGKSAASIMASILRETPPPPMTLVSITPAALDRIVMRCLAKEPDDRFQHVRDLRFALEELQTEAAPLAPAKPSRLWQSIAAALAVALVAGAAVLLWKRTPASTEAPNQTLSLLPPPGHSFTARGGLALSPSGNWLAFASGGELWLRNIQNGEARKLTAAAAAGHLFWSPDDRVIAFNLGQRLQSIDIRADTVKEIGPEPGRSRGGTWSRDGQILVAGIHQSSAVGGTWSARTTPRQGKSPEFHYWPWFLPDGKHYLYTSRSQDPKRAGIFLASLDAAGAGRQLFPTASKAEVVPASGGYPPYILYVRDSVLLAHQLDPATFRPAGDPIRVASPVGFHGNTTWANFTTSQTGVLIYGRRGTARTKLVWLDRQGKAVETIGGVQDYSGLALSPDNKRVFVRRNEERGTTSMWMLDLVRGVSSQLTDYGMTAAWSPDGTEAVYVDMGKARLLRKRIDDAGPAAELGKDDPGAGFVTWSPNGQYLYRNRRLMSLSGGTTKEILTLPEDACSFAPDTRWMVCTSMGSVVVYSVPDGKTRYAIATESAFDPRWSPAGNEIFYRSLDGRDFVSVAVRPTGQGLTFDAPKPLFRAAMSDQEAIYQVSKDGQRFLAIMPEDEDGPGDLTVMTNWREAVKKK